MKKYVWIILFSSLFFSCKSKFEKVRTSNDAERIYKEALNYYDKEDWIKAQTLLELSIPNYRGKTEAEDLFYKYAYTHYYNGEYILAAHYFNRFAATFYNSDKKEEADYMSAYSHYQMSPNARLDQTYTLKAIEGFERFANTYPQSERVEKVNELIDEMRDKLEVKAFQQGELYYNIGQYESAVQSFENMLAEFPDAASAEKVRYLMIKSMYEFAKKSIYDKKVERFSEAVSLYNKFVKKHPTSKYKSEVEDIYKYSLEEINKLKS